MLTGPAITPQLYMTWRDTRQSRGLLIGARPAEFCQSASQGSNVSSSRGVAAFYTSAPASTALGGPRILVPEDGQQIAFVPPANAAAAALLVVGVAAHLLSASRPSVYARREAEIRKKFADTLRFGLSVPGQQSAQRAFDGFLAHLKKLRFSGGGDVAGAFKAAVRDFQAQLPNLLRGQAEQPPAAPHSQTPPAAAFLPRPGSAAPPAHQLSAAPQLAAPQRAQLAGVRSQAGALKSQAQAVQPLTAAKLAPGGPARELAHLQQDITALLRSASPALAAYRHELQRTQEVAASDVARLYRITVHKAIAGAPFSPQVLKALLRQATTVMKSPGVKSPGDDELLQVLSDRLQQDSQKRQATGLGERSTVTHTNTARGTVKGEPEEALNRQARKEQAERLERAAQQAYEALKNGLPGKDQKQFLEDLADRHGVSVASLTLAILALAVSDRAQLGAVKASAAGHGSGGPGGSGLPSLSQDQLTSAMASLLGDGDSSLARVALPRILSAQPGVRDVFQIDFPDPSSGAKRPFTLALAVLKQATDPRLVLLRGALGTGSVFDGTHQPEYSFKLRVLIQEGQLKIEGHRSKQPVAVDHEEGWKPGGFRNATENTHLPEAFWRPEISRQELKRALRRTSLRYDPTWKVSPAQKLTILALFDYRDLLGTLTNHRYATRDEARGALLQTTALIGSSNPKALLAETGWWVYPRDDKTWGISLPIIGTGFERITGSPDLEASVNPMNPSMRPVQSSIAQAWELLHTHPPRKGRMRKDETVGLSVPDVVAFLAAFQPGEALLVDDNGAQYRLTLAPDAQNLSESLRQDAAARLKALYEEALMIGASATTNPSSASLFRARSKLKTYLNGLPLQFERFSERLINSRPIDSPLLLGPSDGALNKTPLPALPDALEQRFREVRRRHAP
jgi:hypothetical protein